MEKYQDLGNVYFKRPYQKQLLSPRGYSKVNWPSWLLQIYSSQADFFQEKELLHLGTLAHKPMLYFQYIKGENTVITLKY